MAYISDDVRQRVIATARNRCSYCLTTQLVSGAQMHIDHIIPLARGGSSDEANLCLACAWCNGYKGDQLHAVDPVTGEDNPLFNPRTQRWFEHFTWDDDGVHILGLTATGRATVVALRLNNDYILPSRRLWVSAGWHPPQE